MERRHRYRYCRGAMLDFRECKCVHVSKAFIECVRASWHVCCLGFCCVYLPVSYGYVPVDSLPNSGSRCTPLFPHGGYWLRRRVDVDRYGFISDYLFFSPLFVFPVFFISLCVSFWFYERFRVPRCRIFLSAVVDISPRVLSLYISPPPLPYNCRPKTEDQI